MFTLPALTEREVSFEDGLRFCGVFEDSDKKYAAENISRIKKNSGGKARSNLVHQGSHRKQLALMRQTKKA
jgi:hypothetical protein